MTDAVREVPAPIGRQVQPADRSGTADGTDGFTLGAEEEFHVVDRRTRELVPRAAEILHNLPEDSYSPELHRCVVESNSRVCGTLDELRADVVRLRNQAMDAADALGLGLVAAGTVPLVDVEELEVTPTTRFQQMLDDYQLLAREQLICGAQVHVGIPDRDTAVAVSRRVSPALPVLLALSASSPYWMGEDSGYASARSLVWQRWPTAGDSGDVRTAAEHDALVADLVASGTIMDPGMVYFDVRPSAHVPTVELRVTDACPEVDTLVLLAGLFRALVRRECAAIAEGRPATMIAPPLLRAAMWRAARSGLEGDLLDLPRSPQPVPAAEAVRRLVADLRPYLGDDAGQVTDLAEQALARGSSADRQRRVFNRRARLADVVDLLIESGREPESPSVPVDASPAVLRSYRQGGDEALPGDPTDAVDLTATRQPSEVSDDALVGVHPGYREIMPVLDALGAIELRQREVRRDEEQRSRGVTFTVDGAASTRLFPFDLIPRIVPADDWSRLTAGLTQRARALDAFLHDIYSQRSVVRDGILPDWLVEGVPELRPSGALMRWQPVRANVTGMDLVRDTSGTWRVLEDNLRVPSGIGYAMQNRRLTGTVMSELPVPAQLLPVDRAPAMLLDALRAVAPPRVDDPTIVVLSEGRDDSAWFEHQLLAREMGVELVRSRDLLVDDRMVYVYRQGGRRPVHVMYLRMGEDSLLHSAGADGRPLGPALLGAVDAGNVALANALGNGVGDDKAVYAYVAKFIEYYLGEQPLLADVRTYLCGIPEQREYVLSRLAELVCKPVDGYGGDRVLIGPLADEGEIESTRRQILAAPQRWVAQDVVDLSTCPVFDGVGLAPRHVDLRAFVFLGERAEVAPVALTRVAPEGSMIVNSSQGGGSKDTWLLRPTDESADRLVDGDRLVKGDRLVNGDRLVDGDRRPATGGQ